MDGIKDTGEKEQNEVGRPPHIPTDETKQVVEAMSGVGVQQKLIAASLDISENTLRKYYAKEINIGRAKAHTKMATSIFNRAFQSDRLAEFYARTQMRWADRAPEVEDGAMQGIVINVIPKAENDYDDPET